MLKASFIVFIILGGCIINKSIIPKFEKLTQSLDYISEKEKAMGEVSIIQGGEEVYSKSYGFLKQSEKSIYRIGSLSKVYTAVMIMKLVESQRLNLSTRLSDFYPQLAHSTQITIKHLLQHRSGLVNFTSLPNYFEFHEKPQTEKSLIEMFVQNGVGFKPDTQFEYSNTGYVLLSLILEKIHGTSFSEILLKEISRPLGLRSTYIYNSDSPLKNEVPSYKKAAKWIRDTNTHQTVPMGAGAIASTSKEVGIFLWSLFNGKILKTDTVTKMKSVTEGYGLGLMEIPFNDRKGYGHTGGIDSFVSVGFHFHDLDTVVVNLTNALSMKMNDISIALLSSVYELDYTHPKFEDEIKLTIEIIKKYEGLYKAEKLPIDLNIFVKDGILFAQGTGQPSLAFTAVKADTFVNSGAGVELVFEPSSEEMTLNQAGQSWTLKR